MGLPVLARLAFRPSQRALFAAGPLRERWAERYPDLFDARDLEGARNQPGYHFYEWLAAVSLFESTGWLSLVEKYQFAHERKRAVLDRLGAQRLVDFFAEQHEAFGRLQAPDLLLYDPDGTDFVFCEVKGPRDRLRPEQARYFAALEAAAGRPVYAVTVASFPP